MAYSRKDIDWLLEQIRLGTPMAHIADDPDVQKQINEYQSLQQMMSGANSTNIKDIYSQISGNSQLQDWLSPFQSEQMSNLLAEYNAQHDLTNQAQQLQSLGLSSGNVIQTGGSTAQTGFHNTAEERENRDVQRAGQKIGLAKAFIGLAGGLASAGVYGATRSIVGRAIQKTSASAASSALKAPSTNFSKDAIKGHRISQRKWDKMIEELSR